MIKVLFICHGNICRSPMAEFIMKDIVTERGLEDEFEIASCATSTEEIYHGVGNPVYPPAVRELAKHGISCGGKRAVQLKRSDYDHYDYLICMDSQNLRNAARILGVSSSQGTGKMSKLMSWAGSSRDVADPWYTDDFETTYNDILEGCTAMLDRLYKMLDKVKAEMMQ